MTVNLDATKSFALQALIVQEEEFLLSFGWTKDKDFGMWKPPPGYLARKGVKSGHEPLYDREHAINSQKWTNRNVKT